MVKTLGPLLKKLFSVPRGAPFCQNKFCKNFLIYSESEIHLFGKRIQKISGKRVQTFRCLSCKKRYTLCTPGEFLFGKIRNEAVLEEMWKNWTSYQTLEKLHKRYGRKFGISKKGLLEIKKRMAEKLDKVLILFPENGKFIPLYIREIYVTYKKNHTTSVLFIFQGAAPVPSAVSVLGDEEKKETFIRKLASRNGDLLYIKSPNIYKNLKAKDPLNEYEAEFESYLEKLEFSKWTVARDIDGLHQNMVLLRHAIGSCHQKKIKSENLLVDRKIAELIKIKL